MTAPAKAKKPVPQSFWVFLVLEVICLLVLVAGVAWIYVPAGMIVGGALGVVIFERAAAQVGRTR